MDIAPQEKPPTAAVAPAGLPPSRIVLLIEFAGGSMRRFTAKQPGDYALAVGKSDSCPEEPRITVTFAGNPAAGGMQVHQAPKPPEGHWGPVPPDGT